MERVNSAFSAEVDGLKEKIDIAVSRNPDSFVSCSNEIRRVCFSSLGFNFVRAVTLEPTRKRFYVGQDTVEFLPALESEKRGKIYYRNPDLFDCRKHKVILGREKKINVALYQLKKKMKFNEIFSVFKNCDSYRVFNCFDTAEITAKLISGKENESWERNRGIYIFPEEEECKGDPFWFQIYFDTYGRIHVSESNFCFTQNLEEGSGVVFL